MKKKFFLTVCTGLVITISGCGVSTINPNYTSSNMDLMRIGGDKPTDKEPEIVNMGSYCMKVSEKWKAEGKTPDGQTIWTMDSLRQAAPCQY